MGKHLVMVGAGHAHLTAIAGLSDYTENGHRVTVIGPGQYHYYSGMGSGMLSGIYMPQEARFDMQQLTQVRGGRYLMDEVEKINPHKRIVYLRSGDEIPYDVISFNTGSRIATGAIDTHYSNILKVKPVERMYSGRCMMLDKLRTGAVRVAVVGGGATGIEIAASSARIGEDTSRPVSVTLVTAGKILHRFPPRARILAMSKMKAKGIVVREETRVTGNNGEFIHLNDGSQLPYDIAFIASGTIPSPLFGLSGLPVAPNGGLKVNKYLQSPEFPRVFGGGDCIEFMDQPLDKVGVFAVRQNSILHHNLRVALDGGERFRVFRPQAYYLLILSMGDGTAIFNRRGITFGGSFAFKIKDNIDRKFMSRFQLSGELSDKVNCNFWSQDPE